uniref:Uncharacterized protein n=1 Tax=Zooxanthella nutricula TaxID=1333877 RepID=A0A7S2HLH4_9DINO
MLLECGAVVSHVTGHATALGLRMEGLRIHHFAGGNMTEVYDHTESTLTSDSLNGHMSAMQEAGDVLVFFIFGAFLCGLIIPKNALFFGGKSFYGIALLGNSVLLLAAVLAVAARNEALAEAFTACASGLQNAMCTMHLGAVVRTTHVTGTSTDIGSTLGRITMIMLRRGCRRRRLTHVEQAEVEVDFTKLKILSAILGSFIFGCFLGAFSYSHIGMYTLCVSASLTGFMGILYTCFRSNLKRALKKAMVQKLAEEMHEVRDMMQHAKTVAAEKSAGVDVSVSSNGDDGDDDEEFGHMLSILHDLQEQVHDFVETASQHSRSTALSDRPNPVHVQVV